MKKTILTILQIFVTAGTLFWVFHDPQKRTQMWEALRQAQVAWLAAGLACYAVFLVLATFRWHLLLRVQGVRLPPWRVGALLMLGLFFNMFMPGGTGGDVLKIYYLLKEVPNKKAEGLLAALMDRLIGLLAMILISSFIIGIQYKWLETTGVSRNLTWVLLALLVSSLAAIVFSFLISGFHLAHKLPAKLPMRDKLIDLSVAYHAYARAWPVSLGALVCSFCIHLSMFFLYCCAARALRVNISTGALLTVMPIILTLASLPISVGGAGVREGLFAALLGPLCGVSQAVAVTLSLTGYMLSVPWGLAGGLIYLLYRPSQHAGISEAGQRVKSLEHEIAQAE